MAFDKSVYEHPDKLGEGAKKRREMLHTSEDKEHAVMGEFKRGHLRSGSGEHVKSHAQAVAIAMSEAGKSKPQFKGITHQGD